MLATAEDDATIKDAAKQMGQVVRKLIQDSFADLLYARAAENLGVMREEMINLEVPGLYNKFLTGLKKSILSGELNGDRREMWFKHVIGGRLGLITLDESEVSEVTAEEAKKVSSLLSMQSFGMGADCSSSRCESTEMSSAVFGHVREWAMCFSVSGPCNLDGTARWNRTRQKVRFVRWGALFVPDSPTVVQATGERATPKQCHPWPRLLSVFHCMPC